MLPATKRNLGLVLAVPACLAAMAVVAVARPVGLFTTKGAYSFVSAPTLHPPVLKTDTKPDRRRLAPGDWFLTNEQSSAYNRPMIGEGGPMIVDRNLQPVWFSGVGTHQVAADLKLQTYNGKPALSWWEGMVSRTGITEKGTLVVLDQSYRSIAKIVAPTPWVISLHDAVVQGTDVWVTAYRSVPNQNLKPYGGPSKATLYDAAFQEYDLKTGKLVSTWDALTHVPLSDSYASVIKNTSWDAYHINSLQLVGSGEMLVSMRNTWAAYLVNIATGKTIWTLGGKRSSFSPKTPFRFQHDVELHGNDVVSAFDDDCCNQTGPGKFQNPFGPASGVVLKLNMSHHSVSQVAQYTHVSLNGHGKLVVAFLGNTELLPDGNVVIGWGSEPFFSELTKHGKLVFDGRWPGVGESYRAYVQPWVGKPYYAPSGAVKTKGGKTTVYSSWNGATEVVKWEVMAGSSASHLKVVATAAKTGFETAIVLKAASKVYRVVALDKHKKVLGTSAAFS